MACCSDRSLTGASRRRRAAVVVMLAAAAVLLGTAQPASAGSVSGMLGTPGDVTLQYTIAGADGIALKPGSTNRYLGSSSGGPITISGTISITLAVGHVSAVSMSADIAGTAKWQWPATGGSENVTGRTVTQTFSLTYTPIPSDAVRGFVYGGANVTWCGGICASLGVGFDFTVPRQPATPPTSQPKPPTTDDTTPPTVRAIPIGVVLRIGTRYRQRYWVKDDSGKAYVYADLYDGGTRINHARSQGLTAANGTPGWANVTPGSKRKGPLEFCVHARDAAGNASARAPRSSCAWLDVLVPIKNVSNQCGGAGWDSVVAFENWVGNRSSFYDNQLGERFVVDFRDACNIHDAGYGGATVRDILAGRRGHRPIVNFRRWSRREVDDKFQADMKKICLRDIPRRAAIARYSCVTGTGRYEAVRLVGGSFFDADLRTAGIQATGHRVND
jgi:hypothetical protein